MLDLWWYKLSFFIDIDIGYSSNEYIDEIKECENRWQRFWSQQRTILTSKWLIVIVSNGSPNLPINCCCWLKWATEKCESVWERNFSVSNYNIHTITINVLFLFLFCLVFGKWFLCYNYLISLEINFNLYGFILPFSINET